MPTSRPKPASTRTAVDDLSKRVSEVAQRRKHTDAVQTIRGEQLTLYDIAPWDDDQRVLPNVLARAALFTTRHAREPREDCIAKPIFNYNVDVQLTYTGQELRAADDELVFQQCLEFAKRRHLGQPVHFTLHEMCDAVGWKRGGSAYRQIEKCLTRLQAGALQIESKRVRRLDSLSLVRRFVVKERGTRHAHCEVMVEEDMALLFAGNHYSKVEWVKYRLLTPTARRLYDWITSHQTPYPLQLPTFKSICGSKTEQASKWKQTAKDVCEELVERELVEDAFVKGEEIVVVRSTAIARRPPA